jgi:hypothetical protein
MRCTTWNGLPARSAVRLFAPKGTEIPSVERSLLGMLAAHLMFRDRTKPANRSRQFIAPIAHLQPSPLRFPGQRFGSGKRLARDRCCRAFADGTGYVPIGIDSIIITSIILCVKYILSFGIIPVCHSETGRWHPALCAVLFRTTRVQNLPGPRGLIGGV